MQCTAMPRASSLPRREERASTRSKLWIQIRTQTRYLLKSNEHAVVIPQIIMKPYETKSLHSLDLSDLLPPVPATDVVLLLALHENCCQFFGFCRRSANARIVHRHPQTIASYLSCMNAYRPKKTNDNMLRIAASPSGAWLFQLCTCRSG